ncbi:actin-like ATPase domain-containing protein [Wilcoxina mikolae CBS 423.85]|nr:actin-like ATPase domain-containing protein [Wilcoxina mikolae CBS 423.85]
MAANEVPRELVIGIDFGTTFSGVSWAVNGRDRGINIIRNWPDPSAPHPTSHKVPTAVKYSSEEPHELLNWGFGALRRRNKQESEPFTWFKLLLQPQKLNEDGAADQYRDILELTTLRKLLSDYGKTAEDVTVDFLGCIWGHAKEQLRVRLGSDFMDTYSVRVIFTTPAIWEPNSYNQVKELARKAELPKNIYFVQEPEAAAMAVLKEPEQVNVRDIVTVCDAGGGTCDLKTYEVVKTQPYLEVKEFAVGEGDFCGSIFIDKSFEAYIERHVGRTQYNNIRDKNKRKMRQSFDWGIKPDFKYDLGQNRRLTIDLRGVPDDIDRGIEDGTIFLDPKELNKVFRPTCLKVQKLVERQIHQAISQKKTTVVLLVGGFGESSYLFELLRVGLAGTGVDLVQGNKPWTAVCRGATLWGLERCTSLDNSPRKMIQSRKSQYSYGFRTVDTPPNNEKGKLQGHTAAAITQELQIEWIVRKGDEIREGVTYETELQRKIHIQFLDFGIRRFCDELVYCSYDPPPQWPSDNGVRFLGNLPWNVDCKKIRWHERRNGKSFKFKYTLVLVPGPDTSMEVFAKYRGKKMGNVKVKLGVQEHSVSGEDVEDEPDIDIDDSSENSKWVRPVLRFGR